MISGAIYAATFLLLVDACIASYALSSSNAGSDFFNFFQVESIADPTRGRVNYVNAETAAIRNLTYARGDHFILRADSQRMLDPSGPGRDSVRMKSRSSYTNFAIVFDLRHMPQGCGTWPAVWTVGPNWPYGGEVDIVEGINDIGPNQGTLHTGPGCSMHPHRMQTGQSLVNDCNTVTGCGVLFNDLASYGPSFNRNGGGWYAMERTVTDIKLWFWSRSGNVPPDVRDGASVVNPKNWGTPVAYFPSDQCRINEMFDVQNIVINLTFCGDWAGSQYGKSGCPSSCEDYVNNNPGAFKDAYFDFAWMKIYE